MEKEHLSLLEEILSPAILSAFLSVTDEIDALYDMDRLWGKGYGDWMYEYKYRRGGKTLVTFYAKKDCAAAIVILGKAEREKFELSRESYLPVTREIYENTRTYHDGKWLSFSIDESLPVNDIISLLKLKRRPNLK